MSEAEFAGKRVFITGGSKGVGEEIVRRFVIGGATVGTTARSPLPEGNATKLFVQADISTRDGVDKVVREVLNQFGRGLDILIHNAGGSGAAGGGALVLSDADWQKAFDMNLFCRGPTGSRLPSIDVAARFRRDHSHLFNPAHTSVI